MRARHRTLQPVQVLAGASSALALALALTGCASSSIQSDAASFVSEHAQVAEQAAGAVRQVTHELAHMPSTLEGAQRAELGEAVSRARRKALLAGEWVVSASSEGGEEGAEEENLPRAESEATKAANELAQAMSALQAYLRNPTSSRLASAHSKLARAREKWDESISQLWYLAHRHGAPTI